MLRWEELTEEGRNHANSFYQREVDPLLTPMTIDPAHPFPRVLNKALCLALLLRRKRKGTSGADPRRGDGATDVAAAGTYPVRFKHE